MCFGGGGGAEEIANQQRDDEINRQNRIKAGMASIDNVFSGFNDAFYKKRSDAYMGYAMPEINHQAGEQANNLIYALSRTGNLDSSAAVTKRAELAHDADVQRINAANEALNQQNALRSQVENTRSNLVSELNATGDNSAASASAMRQVQNLNQPTGFSPLGTMFLNFADSVARIGSRAGNAFSGFAGGGAPSLFSPSSGSMSVVGG